MKQILLLLVVASISLPACRYTFGKRVSGNGNMKTEERSVADYRGVSSHGPFDVVLVQDSAYKVSVEAEENLLPYIETYVDNGVLKVRTKDGYNLNSSKGMKVHISAPSFSVISTVGSGNIVSENMITNSSAIKLDATGSGDIRVKLNAPEINADLTGSGNINLEGETKNFNGEIMGSGDIRAYDLKSENVGVEILGSGNAEVFASMKLKVEINGSGDVKYKGDGAVSSSIHGSGNVRKVQ